MVQQNCQSSGRSWSSPKITTYLPQFPRRKQLLQEDSGASHPCWTHPNPVFKSPGIITVGNPVFQVHFSSSLPTQQWWLNSISGCMSWSTDVLINRLLGACTGMVSLAKHPNYGLVNSWRHEGSASRSHLEIDNPSPCSDHQGGSW